MLFSCSYADVCFLLQSGWQKRFPIVRVEVDRHVPRVYDDVHHPEQWADSVVGKVAGEVKAANARAAANYFGGYNRETAFPDVPPEKRDWRAVFDKTEPPKPKGQPR